VWRERGNGSNKNDMTLVHMSQKCTSSKKNSREKYYDICNYCKNKGHWAKKIQKGKKRLKIQKT
jgi:hypothetical protein